LEQRSEKLMAILDNLTLVAMQIEDAETDVKVQITVICRRPSE